MMEEYQKQEKAKAFWNGNWLPVVVIESNPEKHECLVHYEGFDRSEDEWLPNAMLSRSSAPRDLKQSYVAKFFKVTCAGCGQTRNDEEVLVCQKCSELTHLQCADTFTPKPGSKGKTVKSFTQKSRLQWKCQSCNSTAAVPKGAGSVLRPGAAAAVRVRDRARRAPGAVAAVTARPRRLRDKISVEYLYTIQYDNEEDKPPKTDGNGSSDDEEIVWAPLVTPLEPKKDRDRDSGKVGSLTNSVEELDGFKKLSSTRIVRVDNKYSAKEFEEISLPPTTRTPRKLNSKVKQHSLNIKKDPNEASCKDTRPAPTSFLAVKSEVNRKISRPPQQTNSAKGPSTVNPDQLLAKTSENIHQEKDIGRTDQEVDGHAEEKEVILQKPPQAPAQVPPAEAPAPPSPRHTPKVEESAEILAPGAPGPDTEQLVAPEKATVAPAPPSPRHTPKVEESAKILAPGGLGPGTEQLVAPEKAAVDRRLPRLASKTLAPQSAKEGPVGGLAGGELGTPSSATPAAILPGARGGSPVRDTSRKAKMLRRAQEEKDLFQETSNVPAKAEEKSPSLKEASQVISNPLLKKVRKRASKEIAMPPPDHLPRKDLSLSSGTAGSSKRKFEETTADNNAFVGGSVVGMATLEPEIIAKYRYYWTEYISGDDEAAPTVYVNCGTGEVVRRRPEAPGHTVSRSPDELYNCCPSCKLYFSEKRFLRHYSKCLPARGREHGVDGPKASKAGGGWLPPLLRRRPPQEEPMQAENDQEVSFTEYLQSSLKKDEEETGPLTQHDSSDLRAGHASPSGPVATALVGAPTAATAVEAGGALPTSLPFVLEQLLAQGTAAPNAVSAPQASPGVAAAPAPAGPLLPGAAPAGVGGGGGWAPMWAAVPATAAALTQSLPTGTAAMLASAPAPPFHPSGGGLIAAPAPRPLAAAAAAPLYFTAAGGGGGAAAQQTVQAALQQVQAQAQAVWGAQQQAAAAAAAWGAQPRGGAAAQHSTNAALALAAAQHAALLEHSKRQLMGPYAAQFGYPAGPFSGLTLVGGPAAASAPPQQQQQPAAAAAAAAAGAGLPSAAAPVNAAAAAAMAAGALPPQHPQAGQPLAWQVNSQGFMSFKR